MAAETKIFPTNRHREHGIIGVPRNIRYFFLSHPIFVCTSIQLVKSALNLLNLHIKKKKTAREREKKGKCMVLSPVLPGSDGTNSSPPAGEKGPHSWKCEKLNTRHCQKTHRQGRIWCYLIYVFIHLDKRVIKEQNFIWSRYKEGEKAK